MRETEVLKRIGIKNKNHLLLLLHRSNISRCIWQKTNYYKLVPTVPKLIKRIKTLELTESFKPIDINKKITLNYFRRDKVNLQRENRYVGWKVKIPRQVLLKEDISDYYNTNDGIPHNNLVHRGHLFGKQFKKFLFESSSIKNGTIHFFDKNNIDNIYQQFSRANCNDNFNNGQSYFEKIVCGIIENYTSKGIFECCYYEVEAIFLDIDDKMPVGSRILFFDKENFENSFHVFIPNFSEKYVLENSSYLEYRKRYKSGFSKKDLQFIGSNYNC
ncbi:MAG: hypothetical protein E6733_00475 [Streptococcus parasanguinis]|nr:hypothetical protein [Streptococcus parasanguinis]MDU1991745.1 hypothetical protein [Streptococcus parasanguinis]